MRLSSNVFIAVLCACTWSCKAHESRDPQPTQPSWHSPPADDDRDAGYSAATTLPQAAHDMEPLAPARVVAQPVFTPIYVHDSYPWWMWHSSQPSTVVHEHYYSSPAPTTAVHALSPAPAVRSYTPAPEPTTRSSVQSYVSRPARTYTAPTPTSPVRVQSYVSRTAASYSRPRFSRGRR
jgi:hypothetical protein